MTSSLEEWKKKESKESDGKLAEEWVKNVNWDASTFSVIMLVDLDFSETFPVSSLVIPESYPKGIYNLCFGEKIIEFKAATLCEAIDKSFLEFEKQRDALLDEIQTPGTAKSSSYQFEDFDEPETPSHEIFIETSVDENKKIEEQIHQELCKVRKTKGWNGEPGAISSEQIRIYLMIDPRKRLGISPLVAHAWRINLDMYITLALTFSGYYLETVSPPQIDVYQSGNTKSNKSKLAPKNKFGLYWTVEQRFKEIFLKKNWPIDKFYNNFEYQGKNYMEAMLGFTEDVIKTSPGLCIICGNSMSHIGIKPTVCESQLCIFSHEQYGLGVDLESAITTEPDLVDLMISMSFAASEVSSSAKYNPFNPFPYIEIKIKNQETGSVETYNCLTNGNPDNQKCKTVLEKIPPVSTLGKWVEEGKLKENCDNLHPLLYSMLRWILGSNRSHLKKLQFNERIKSMGTEHQYTLVSSPPEKESKFQEYKRNYGSVYAFHGSALCNWHNIMRYGLKNMSGTKGMANGAAYGNGIYLATESGTSFGYMRYQKGWPQSMFGSSNIGCLALCEIALHPCLNGQPNPYYVVANEDLVQTRCFFVYTSGQSTSVVAKNIQIPKMID